MRDGSQGLRVSAKGNYRERQYRDVYMAACGSTCDGLSKAVSEQCSEEADTRAWRLRGQLVKKVIYSVRLTLTNDPESWGAITVPKVIGVWRCGGL